MAKLTPVQERVMWWLNRGRNAEQMSSSDIHLRDSFRLCSLKTIKTLERMGLVKLSDAGNWRATAKAKAEAETGKSNGGDDAEKNNV